MLISNEQKIQMKYISSPEYNMQEQIIINEATGKNDII